MRRWFLCVMAALSVSALHAQAPDRTEEEPPPLEIFPLAPVLEGAKYAGFQVWQPDWPVELPPDAFRVFPGPRPPGLNSDFPPDSSVLPEISGITLERGASSLSLRFDSSGRVEEFPFVFHFPRGIESPEPAPGRMTQVSLVYGDSGNSASGGDVSGAKNPSARLRNPPPLPPLREMHITFLEEEAEDAMAPAAAAPSEGGTEEGGGAGSGGTGSAAPSEPWKLEFLEYRDSFPYLVRGFRGGVWYFVYFFRSGNEIRETWYGAEGEFLGAYGFSLAELDRVRRIISMRDFSASGGETFFYYDSRGFLTEISGPRGLYNVHYFKEDLPRYREYYPPEDRAGEESPAPLPAAGASQAADTLPALGGLPADVLAVPDNPPAAGNFSLEWDERDLLVKQSSLSGAGDEPEGAFVDYRYEYSFDERGNWIERREIKMARVYGLLVPVGETLTRRVLEYGERR